MDKIKFRTANELFPELADKTNVNRYKDFMKVEDFKIFVDLCLKHADHEITEYENKVAEVVCDLMIRKGLLTDTNHQTYVDTLLIASLLHNVYFDETRISSSLFIAREEFDQFAEHKSLSMPIPEEFREMIWDTMEGHLGDCTPMSKTKPSANSPQDLFATAVWIVRSAYQWFYE